MEAAKIYAQKLWIYSLKCPFLYTQKNNTIKIKISIAAIIVCGNHTQKCFVFLKKIILTKLRDKKYSVYTIHIDQDFVTFQFFSFYHNRKKFS